LRIEALEARWVPSALHASSTNWSGYAVNSTAGSVTAVSGQWTVPTVTGTGSGTTYSSVWVGIDGSNSPTVEQTGIEADVSNGVAQYSAWYEMYPAYPVTVNLAIHPNDKISASVVYNSNGQFVLTIQDLSDPAGHNTFSITQSAPGAQRSSAEWIVEAPSSSRGVLPLANFGTVTITNAQATINQSTGPINNPAWASGVEAINMVSRSGALEAGTSALDATGTAFTVTFGATGTAPGNPTTPTTPPTPNPGAIATTTTLTGAVNPSSWWPSVTLTATVSPSVPVGSQVELMLGNRVVAIGRVRLVNGVEEVSFDVTFFRTGVYNFTAVYLGSGQYQPSTSNTVTVTVT
jgi:hypothetical protein